MTVDQIQGLRPGQEIDPSENPELANQLANMAMGLGSPDDAPPLLIESPPDGTVTLPGGYVDGDGTVHRYATVRELTGADEEELQKPGVVRSFAKFIDVLLNNCVVEIGGQTANKRMLDELLIGDREMLIQAIRVATYGDTMRLDSRCPFCEDKHQVDYTFSVDVPIKEFDGRVVELDRGQQQIELQAAQRVYTVQLRKGRTAEIRLIDGGTQKALYPTDDDKRSAAEINTALLSRCIEAINGDTVTYEEVRRMSSADRALLLEFLTDAQPGPQWGEVKHSCPSCEREFPFVIDVPTMFRGL